MEKRHRALLVDDPPIRGGSILARAKPETPGDGQRQTEQRSYVHVHTEVFRLSVEIVCSWLSLTKHGRILTKSDCLHKYPMCENFEVS